MPRPVTFIHAADLHLGAPFGSVDAGDERVRRALAAAPYQALERVVDACVSRAVDFLVIAGDVYEDADPALPVRAALARAMARLGEAGIPAFAVNGNHDPASGAAAAGTPPNVRYFSTAIAERTVVEREGETLAALYGRGYERREQPEDLAAGFRREPGDRVAIGVLHTNVGGRPDDGSYAPSTLEDLRAAGMDYWALGHIHQPELVLDTPRARYAGCVQGLNPKETGPRGCWVVTVEGRHVADEFVETDSVRWAAEEVDVTGAESEDAVLARACEACDRVRDAAGGRPSVVRLTLTGRSGAHRRLLRPGAGGHLLDAVRDDQLRGPDWVWVDRVADASRPETDASVYADADNFVGEIVRIASAKIADPAAAARLVAARTDGVVARFRIEGFTPDPASVVSRALDLCLDGLVGEEE